MDVREMGSQKEKANSTQAGLNSLLPSHPYCLWFQSLLCIKMCQFSTITID